MLRTERGFLSRTKTATAKIAPGDAEQIVGREARWLVAQLALLILLFRVGARPRQLKRWAASLDNRVRSPAVRGARYESGPC